MSTALKTRSEDVAREAYERLQTKAPALYPTPWAHLPEPWQIALAFAVQAGSETATERLFQMLSERTAPEARLQ